MNIHQGIAYVLGACFCWGFIFAIPGLLPQFSMIEVALGRCFLFGLVSLVILFFQKKGH